MVAKRPSGSRAAQRTRPRGPVYPKWSEAENRVVDRFARAIVSSRYPNVNQALPDCRRELEHVTPGLERTEDAVAWKLLCRAYDFGLPRRMHFWTDQEKGLLERHASALARGEYPNAGTAVRQVKRAFERAGLAVRHHDSAIRYRVIVRSHALGRPRYSAPLGPGENRVLDRFVRALRRNEYRCGKAAAADCRRALAQAGSASRRREGTIAKLINDRARALGRTQEAAPWSASGVRIIDRYARAFVSGRHPSMTAASRACRPVLERIGQFDNRTEGGLRCKLRVRVIGMGKSGFKPRWSVAELRILDRYVRAFTRGAYPTALSAATRCQRALARAGLRVHVRVSAVEGKLHHRMLEFRHKRQP